MHNNVSNERNKGFLTRKKKKKENNGVDLTHGVVVSGRGMVLIQSRNFYIMAEVTV